MADISIHILDRNVENEDLYEFIETSAGGTIFHHPKFLSYHGKDKFPGPEYESCNLLMVRNKEIIGFMPGTLQNTAEGRVYNSPSGASYGGLVTGSEGFEGRDRMVSSAIEYLKGEFGVRKINITPAPHIYSGDEADDTLNYIYLKNGFWIVKCDLTVATRVTQDDGFPRSVFRDRVKSSIAQSARKGVSCSITEDIETAYDIIEKDQKKFGKKPTHSHEEMKTISRLFPGRIVQFIAWKGKDPIAAVCLFVCNRAACYTFYIDQLEEFRDSRPLDYLLNEVLIWAKKKRYMYVDFGPSTFGYEPHKTLIFFKEGFGGKGVMKYHLQYEVR